MKKIILALALSLTAVTANAAKLNRDYVPMDRGPELDYCRIELTTMTGSEIVFQSESGDTVEYNMLDYVCPFLLTAYTHKLKHTKNTINLELKGKHQDGKPWKYDFTFTQVAPGLFRMSHYKKTSLPKRSKMVHDEFTMARNAIVNVL